MTIWEPCDDHMRSLWGRYEEDIRTIWEWYEDDISFIWGWYEECMRTIWGWHMEDMSVIWGRYEDNIRYILYMSWGRYEECMKMLWGWYDDSKEDAAIAHSSTSNLPPSISTIKVSKINSSSQLHLQWLYIVVFCWNCVGVCFPRLITSNHQETKWKVDYRRAMPAFWMRILDSAETFVTQWIVSWFCQILCYATQRTWEAKVSLAPNSHPFFTSSSFMHQSWTWENTCEGQHAMRERESGNLQFLPFNGWIFGYARPFQQVFMMTIHTKVWFQVLSVSPSRTFGSLPPAWG